MFTHDDLVKIGEKWLLNKCGFVFSELTTITGEIPDNIGFKSHCTILIECKANRADFLSDKRKIFRTNPWKGVGAFRFYLCPKDLIKPEELPDKWGLIYVNEKGNARKKIGPKGNTWSMGSKFAFKKRNRSGEKSLMYSALRRLHLQGVMPLIYERFRS